MKIYATEMWLQGSFHIKATSREQAERILDRVCSNTIDGIEDEWFSDMPSRYRQRASFSTKFTVIGPVDGTTFFEVPKSAVYGAQNRWVCYWKGLRSPYSPLSKAHEQVPVYSTILDLTTTVFVRAKGIPEAETLAAGFSHKTLDLLDDNSRWFTARTLEDDGQSDLPIVLSSALYLIGNSRDNQLSQTWPDGPYNGPEFVSIADEFL